MWVTDSWDYWMVLHVTWVFEGLLHLPNSLRMQSEVQMIGVHKHVHIPMWHDVITLLLLLLCIFTYCGSVFLTDRWKDLCLHYRWQWKTQISSCSWSKCIDILLALVTNGREPPFAVWVTVSPHTWCNQATCVLNTWQWIGFNVAVCRQGVSSMETDSFNSEWSTVRDHNAHISVHIHVYMCYYSS